MDTNTSHILHIIIMSQDQDQDYDSSKKNDWDGELPRGHELSQQFLDLALLLGGGEVVAASDVLLAYKRKHSH